MSINSNEGNDFCNRYNEVLKSDKKKMIAVAAACTIVMGAGFGGYLYYGAYYASGWHTHDGSTYYIVKETGEKALGYQIIDNTCYLFDDKGNAMADGWHKYRGDTYYVKDGVVQRGKMKIKGEEYYFSEESGIFRTGLCEINGGEYYFDDHGFPDTGFDSDGGYYYDESGKRVTGWAKINNVQYYFLKNGEMAKGFVEIEGKIYYFDDDDGHMATGWQDIDGKKYYFLRAVLFTRAGWSLKRSIIILMKLQGLALRALRR